MWKMLVGFIVFAVVAVFLLMKGGADVDMSGEKHGAEATSAEHASPEPSSAPAAPEASAPAASEAASAASAS
ncbi:MAG: hypothetical protein RI907_103 [Pseudomonadota bacterium]|jgi:hypothetical protein